MESDREQDSIEASDDGTNCVRLQDNITRGAKDILSKTDGNLKMATTEEGVSIGLHATTPSLDTTSKPIASDREDERPMAELKMKTEMSSSERAHGIKELHTTLRSSSERKPKKKAPREVRELKPAPYFYYIDHSRDLDEHPLAPLTPSLGVPNFIVKLHAILICDNISCIEWMPHGRSWKILNQSEFERQVLPTYFNQGSVASFYRQANGWGFRRMLKGPDKGSFYNELFIRCLPFLAKKMKRIGGAKVIKDANINHEPNLWKISEMYPPPEKMPKHSLDLLTLNTVNKFIQEKGPKAKIPFVHSSETAAAHTSDDGTRKRLDANEMARKASEISDADRRTNVAGGSLNCQTQEAVRTDRSNSSQIGARLLQQPDQRLINGLLRSEQTFYSVMQQTGVQQNQQANSALLSMLTSSSSVARHNQTQHQHQQHHPAQSYDNILSSIRGLTSVVNPSTTHVSVAPPHRTIPVRTNNALHQMALQDGSNTGLPRTPAISNISNIIRQSNLFQANQLQSQMSFSNSPEYRAIMTLVQNGVTNRHSQPATNFVNSQPYLHQTALGQLQQNPSIISPSFLGSSMANDTTQNMQPHQLNQLQLLLQLTQQQQQQEVAHKEDAHKEDAHKEDEEKKKSDGNSGV